MSIDGKKIKEHIGKLKESLDSIAADDAKSLLPCYRLVISSELSQRGVIVPLDTLDDEKLLQAITNAAGKPLLGEHQVKPPLIAGAAVVSAMAAQKLADAMLNKPSEQSPLLSKERCASAFQRCQDVNDDRLLSLLHLATSQAIAKDIPNLEGVALLLLRIAYGNNLRAASFSNPEQPPMFKRSLDACVKAQDTLTHLLRKARISTDIGADILSSGGLDAEDDYASYYTRDAINPLLNLIRIAESKHNPKRVAELSLRITQSYIDGDEAKNYSDVLSESGCQLWSSINHSFVDTYSESKVDGDKSSSASSLKLVMEAKRAVDKFDISLFGDENDLMFILLHKLLQVRVKFAHEDALVVIIGEERYTSSKNRNGLSSGNVTRDTFEDNVRTELVTGTLPAEDAEGIALTYDPIAVDNVTVLLRDALLGLPANVNDPSTLSNDIFKAICSNIERQIDRLVLRAQTIALNSFKKKKRDVVSTAWDAVLEFIDPLMQSINIEAQDASIQDQIKSMPLSQRDLMKTASESLLVHAWMSAEKSATPVSHIRTATTFLATSLALLKETEQAAKKKLEEAEGKVVRTTNAVLSKTQLTLEVACRAATCHQLLTTIGEFN